MYRYKRIQPSAGTPTRVGAIRRVLTGPERDGSKNGFSDSIGNWLGLMAKLGLLYGGAWLFAYCFFVIGFFPAGISAADSFFLLFVAAGFGFVVLILAGVGLHLVDPWFGLLERRKLGDDVRKFPASGKFASFALAVLALDLAWLWWSDFEASVEVWERLIVGLVLVYCVVVFSVKKHSAANSEFAEAIGAGVLSFISLLVLLMLIGFKQWWALGLVFAQGAMAATLATVWRSPRHAKNRGVGLLVLAALNLFVPLYMAVLFKDEHQSMNPALALTFERLGPYRASADVLLSNKAAQQVWQLGTDHEFGMQGCQLDDGSVLVSRVQVLWHGVGTRSLLRFPRADSGSSLAQGRIEVDTADVRLLSTLPHQCAQIPTEVHFASKSEKPLDPKEVEELVDQFSRAIERAPKEWRLTTVQLRGHSDSMPLVKDGNVELGLARAKAVGAELAKQLDKSGRAGRDDVHFDAQSSASRSGRSDTCPLKGDRASLEECHAKSRRVEVRLIFKPPLPKLDKKPQT